MSFFWTFVFLYQLKAILIAHLKLSPGELRHILMNMTTDRLEPDHIKQLLLYAPDEEEVKKYEEHKQEPSKLSEVDQFVLQVQLWYWEALFVCWLWFVELKHWQYIESWTQKVWRHP